MHAEGLERGLRVRNALLQAGIDPACVAALGLSEPAADMSELGDEHDEQ